MGGFVNPILSEIDAAHAGLSPAAKRAIALSGVAPSPAVGAPEAVAANGAAAAPAAGTPAPIAPRPIAGPTPMRGLGPAPAQTDPAQAGNIAEMHRLTAAPLPSSNPLAHTKADTGRSGLEQIKNPWIRHPLEALDAIGTGFFPRLAMGIPGTQLHHNMLVHMQNNAVNEGEKLQGDEAQREHLAAEDAGLPAEADLKEAQADALKHPKPKYGNPIATPEGYVVPNETTSEATPLTVGGKPVQPAAKPDKYTYQQTDHGLFRIDSQTGEATPVTYNGTPLHGADKAETGAQDDQAYEKLLQKESLGQKLSPEEHAQKVAYERRKTLGIATTNVYANQREDRKQDVASRSAAYKAYTPALDSGERFNVMAKNYEDAVKSHDQQAMLSLLANHLGMTMGLQKGARMTKDIIHEAEQSRPWLQGLKAKFDSSGYLQGVTLSPEQMRRMVSLGRERFSEDLTKGRSEANYLGATDEGPKRTPNASTINFYVGLANGDAKKAKQLAAQDGWSIE